jgi:hypothetical protein
LELINNLASSLKFGVEIMKKIIIFAALIFVASISASSQSVWTKNGGINIAKTSATMPAFPIKLSEFRPAGKGKDYWDNPFSENYEDFKTKGTVRVFEDNGWDEIYEFPYTMNHL